MTKFNVISADSHVVEPPNLWLDYIEPAFRARAPHIEKVNGIDVFRCDGGVDLAQPGPVSSATRPGWAMQPIASFDEVPRGGWDPNARLAEILPDGVEAEALFPSVAMRMFALPDPAYQTACLVAYNNWMADFVKQQPERFHGLGLIPTYDMEFAAGELRRCKQIGLSGVCIALSAETYRYDDPRYEPLWAAASEADMSLNLHFATGQKTRARGGQAPPMDAIAESVVQVPVYAMDTLTRLIFSGVFRRHPDLKVVSAENATGWAGYFVERMDYLLRRRAGIPGGGAELGGAEPSYFFRRQVYLSFQRDRAGILAREMIGVDNLMWGSDYPHGDSTWPESLKEIDLQMGDIPAGERRKITRDNAAHVYGFN